MWRKRTTPETPDLLTFQADSRPVLWGGERFLITEWVAESIKPEVRITMELESVVRERQRQRSISAEQTALGDLVARLGSHHPMTEAARAALEGK
jgi:hypothetical protein